MTKQQLEFFLSAAEFSNLSRAAAFHYVSIPTFTRHINDLEEELNTKLFIRSNAKPISLLLPIFILITD